MGLPTASWRNSGLLEAVAWAIFLGLGPVLWASGVWLFCRASLSLPRKLARALFLVAVGLAGY